ncbi:MAG: hypothetical protein R2807_07500 [Chitinophagales bacterium]
MCFIISVDLYFIQLKHQSISHLQEISPNNILKTRTSSNVTIFVTKDKSLQMKNIDDGGRFGDSITNIKVLAL